MPPITRILAALTNLFPVWVLVCSVLALFQPAWFTWFGSTAIVWGLAVIMLGMGITLSLDDFRRVLLMPRSVVIGFVAQYTIMPLLGWGIAHTLSLERDLAVGLILVACCPGGTASNVVTFLARADVALSVLMTMCSTFAAVILTPFLTSLLAESLVPVDAWGLLASTAQVVLFPLIIGLFLHHRAPRLVARVLPVAPLVSVVFIVLIVASVVGGNGGVIRESGVRLLGAVVLLHAGGFAIGYALARLLRCNTSACRTISIEVGMQNSGLGVVLARAHFPGTVASVPCAISSVVHSVIGSLLAAVWRNRKAALDEGSQAPSH